MKRISVGRVAALLGLILLPLAGTACGDDPILGPLEPEDVEFDSSLNVDLDAMTELRDGLFFRILEEGEGQLSAAPNTLAIVNVTAWLADGTQVLGPIESEVLVGVAQEPLAGLALGIEGMFVGEVRQLVLASRLAWGEFGAENVPPNSVVVMEVELLDVTLPR